MRGLQAIVELICRQMEGRLSQVLEQLRGIVEPLGMPLMDGDALASQVAQRVMNDVCGIPVLHPPVMDAGRRRSGGMSWYMHRIANGVAM